MMKFDEFTKYAKEHITDHLPPEYRDAEIRLDEVNKMNERYTGLTVRLEDNVSTPVVNLDLFYQQYEDNRPIDAVMSDMAGIALMKPPAEIDIEAMKDYSKIRDKLFVRLNFVDGNEKVMADSPHHMAADMMMTYHIYIPDRDGNGGFMSARITNEMLKDLGVSQEQLHMDAIANTEKLFKPKVVGMMEALTGAPEKDPQMMIVTNEQGSLGAAALFCAGIMDKAAEHMKGNYFVLPSSIHETLIVPDNGDFDRKDLESMVREANRTVVDPADRLSDSVYHYDQKDRIFERADAFEKRTQIRTAQKESLLGRLQDKKDQVGHNAPAVNPGRQHQAGLVM